MRHHATRPRSFSYVVTVGGADLRELASYLSRLGAAGGDIVILDPSNAAAFQHNARILRWVGRHISLRSGGVLRAAATHAACEKVIVASDDVRYDLTAMTQVCALLDSHEVVAPQDYVHPLPWWGGLEQGGILVHRAVLAQPDRCATFAVRRGTIRALRARAVLDAVEEPLRVLKTAGAEISFASSVFARRESGSFRRWLERRPVEAAQDFALPAKTAFLLSLVPLLLVMAIVGGVGIALAYAGLIAFCVTILALRGRSGAAEHFPLYASLFGPLWLLERSLAVYWALFAKVAGTGTTTARIVEADAANQVAKPSIASRSLS